MRASLKTHETSSTNCHFSVSLQQQGCLIRLRWHLLPLQRPSPAVVFLLCTTPCTVPAQVFVQLCSKFSRERDSLWPKCWPSTPLLSCTLNLKSSEISGCQANLSVDLPWMFLGSTDILSWNQHFCLSRYGPLLGTTGTLKMRTSIFCPKA